MIFFIEKVIYYYKKSPFSKKVKNPKKYLATLLSQLLGLACTFGRLALKLFQ